MQIQLGYKVPSVGCCPDVLVGGVSFWFCRRVPSTDASPHQVDVMIFYGMTHSIWLYLQIRSYFTWVCVCCVAPLVRRKWEKENT
jgi:hypothetical protein